MSCLLWLRTNSYPFCWQCQRLRLSTQGGGGFRAGKGLPCSQNLLCEGRLASTHCLCPQWQVLNKAKNRIQELEQTLDELLKLKGKPSIAATPLPPRVGLVGFFCWKQRDWGKPSKYIFTESLLCARHCAWTRGTMRPMPLSSVSLGSGRMDKRQRDVWARGVPSQVPDLLLRGQRSGPGLSNSKAKGRSCLPSLALRLDIGVSRASGSWILKGVLFMPWLRRAGSRSSSPVPFPLPSKQRGETALDP